MRRTTAGDARERSMGDRHATRALIVDDEADIRGLVRDVLESEGMSVLEAPDGKAALRLLYDERPDLVVLDVMMPALDGWQTLGRIREVSDVPVIMLTARSLEWELARGLRAGADDYLIKPFSPMELAARAVALLRRARRGELPEIHDDGFLHVDYASRTVTAGGREVRLSPIEFRMLGTFIQNAGRVIGRDEMLAAVWGGRGAVFPEQVKLYVGYLRRKLGTREDGTSPIETVRGFGYVYRAG